MPVPIRVLLVDDDPDVLDLTRAYLDDVADDLEVRTAVGGEAALEALAAARPDCVVSDYDMPDLDGLALLRAVREDHANLPFILFTGKGSEEIASEAIAAGVTDYLRKQAGRERYEMLANRVVNAVERRRAERRARGLNRINRVIRRVQRGLVAAQTRADVERVVCDELAAASPYEFAWIGELDERGALEPRVTAGSAAPHLLEAIASTDAATRREGSGAVAARTGEPRAVQDIGSDPRSAPWREHFTGAGLRSMAAVPLSYGAADYGVLLVYAGRAHAFDEDEMAVLCELGDTVARAIDAAETSRALDFANEVVEGVGVGVGAYDATGEIVYVNAGLEALLGYDREELLDRHVWELSADFDRAGFERYWAGFDPGETRTVESTYRRADGSTLHVDATTTRVEIDGTPYHVGTLTDISERIERHRELETYARRYEAVFDDPAAFIGLLEPDGTLLQANDTALRFVDAEPEDVAGEPFWETPWWTFSADVQAELRDHVEAAADGEFVRFEVENRGADGASATLDTIIRPVHDDDGAIVALIAEGRNVTDRKRLERELRRSRDALQELYAASSTPGSTFRERLRDVLAAGSDHLDLPIAALTTTGDDDALRVVDCRGLDGVAPGDEFAIDGTGPLDAPDGEVEILDVTASECDTDPGNRFGIRAALGRAVTVDGARDGTLWFASREPRPAGFSDFERSFVELLARWASDELERRRANDRLERQNERLERFAAIVTHDLRNPLTTATGWLDAARRDVDDDRLDRVAAALDRMDELIDDVRTMTWSGTEVTDPDEVSLPRVASAAWSTCGQRGATLDVDADLGLVRADESRLQQLLENLFRNAIEHGSSGVGGVCVDLVSLPDGFAVVDDGPGVPEADRDRVFDHGFSTTDEGTGFGLNIVAEVAAAHGWSVAVTEAEAGGARFEVTGVEFVD